MSLVTTVLNNLTPALVNRMAASLGLGQGIVTKAISAAVPAILSGIASSLSKNGGIFQLTRVLARNDASLLRTFGSQLGTSAQQPLTDAGLNALVALLGAPQTNALSIAVGKFTGLNSTQAGSLVGLLTPVVLAHVAQAQKATGSDPNALFDLLTTEAASSAAALPAGFPKLFEQPAAQKQDETTGETTTMDPTGSDSDSNEFASTEHASPSSEPTPPPSPAAPAEPPEANDGPSIAATLPPGENWSPSAPAPALEPFSEPLQNYAVMPSVATTVQPKDFIVPPAPVAVVPTEAAASVVQPREEKLVVPPIDAPLTISKPTVEATLQPGAERVTPVDAPNTNFAPVDAPAVPPSIAATLEPGVRYVPPYTPPSTPTPAAAAAVNSPPAPTPAADPMPPVTPAPAPTAIAPRPATPASIPLSPRVDVAAAAAAAAQLARGHADAAAKSQAQPLMQPQAPSQAASPSKPAVSVAPPVQPPTPPAPVTAPVPAPVPASATVKAPIIDPPKPAPPSAPVTPAKPLQTVAAKAPSTEPETKTTKRPPAEDALPQQPSRALGVLRRLVAACFIGGLIGAGLYALAQHTHRLAGASTPTTETVAAVAADANAAAIAKQSVDRMTAALANITDTTSAEVAATDLAAVGRDIAILKSSAPQLPASVRQSLADVIKAALPDMVPLAEKALAIAGVEQIVSPVLTPIMADFDDLAKT